MSIDARTAKALAELGRVAARHIGIPDDVVITMSVCQDREYDWCGLVDGEPDLGDQSDFGADPGEISIPNATPF
jgi:hypothetical protein